MTEIMLGNAKKAFAIFTQVLQMDPDHVDSLIRLGNICGKLARYHDAIAYYDKALRVEPGSALALINKGLALHYLERYDEAISCYDLVISSRPDSALAKYNKASSAVRAGNAKEGLEMLADAIRIDLSYKYKARADVDFEPIKKTVAFKKIVA